MEKMSPTQTKIEQKIEMQLADAIKPYLRQIEQCKELLKEDLAKLSSKPKGWVKIRNKINRHLKWVELKQCPLDERAFALTSYLKFRESFKNILDNNQRD